MSATKKFRKIIPKKPHKFLNVKPSKYETAEAIHMNRKYWKEVFDHLDPDVVKILLKARVRRNAHWTKILDKWNTTLIPMKESDELQHKEEESLSFSRVLPDTLYEKVCTLLDLPVQQYEEIEQEKIEEKPCTRIIKEPLISLRKTIRIEKEVESDTEVEYSPRAPEVVNVHYELLSKPEREQVTWATRYLLPEKDDEKTLVRKADDLTDRIVEEFCEYMKQLGGDQQSQLFKAKTVKELFQIEFDTHAARSIQVVPRELPCVEEKIAAITNTPEFSRYAVLEREVARDIKAERRSDRSQAFRRSLPFRDQYRAPRNDTEAQWRSARRVPKELVSLKTVWEGITNLRSVKEYCRWMIDHPEYKRAPYLSSLGMFDPAVLEARLTFELPSATATGPTNTPAPIEHLRKRLSQLADTN